MAADYWRDLYKGEYARQTYIDGDAMTDYVESFFDQVSVPESFASVGCGPAVTEFDLATRYPDTTFACFDISEPLIRDNRRYATEQGVDNITFDVAALPDIDLGRRFDVVYCMATLAFVADAESALQALYDHVAPNGHLVAHYPTKASQEYLREHGDDQPIDFSLVEDGVNLFSERTIEQVLGTPPQDYWATTGATGYGSEISGAAIIPR